MATRKAVAVVGPSGCGKTTLLNNIFPGFDGAVGSAPHAVTRNFCTKVIGEWTVIDSPGNDVEDKNFPDLFEFDEACVLVVATGRYLDVFKKFRARYSNVSLLCVRGYGTRKAPGDTSTTYGVDPSASDFPARRVIQEHCGPVVRSEARAAPLTTAAASVSQVLLVDIRCRSKWTWTELHQALDSTVLSHADIKKNSQLGDAILLVALRKHGFEEYVVDEFKSNDPLCRFLELHERVSTAIKSAFDEHKRDELKAQTLGDGIETMFAWGALQQADDPVKASRQRKRNIGGFLLAQYVQWVAARVKQ